jgi:hypothetical protein
MSRIQLACLVSVALAAVSRALWEWLRPKD